jgi:hypothetical protein
MKGKKVKKTIYASIFLAFVSILILNGCDKDSPVTQTPVNSTKGIFVLYEGVFGQPSTYDYGFIDKNTDEVHSNVFQNSNNGANLNTIPDGMSLYVSQLYVLSQGNFGQQGTIYKINPENNKLIASKTFGLNPYNFAFGNNVIYVTNTSGSNLTVMDLNFNIINDTVNVGPNPSDLVITGSYAFVAKQSYTYENSLAIVHLSDNQVRKVILPGPPAGIGIGENWLCVSTYAYKKIYRFYGDNSQLIDSFAINIAEPAIGQICFCSSGEFYFLGVADTAYSSNIGKRIYKFNLYTGTIDPGFNISFSGINDAYSIAYSSIEQKLYVLNSKSGQGNGELRVYDNSGTLVKTYPDIGGKYPRRIVFKY